MISGIFIRPESKLDIENHSSEGARCSSVVRAFANGGKYNPNKTKQHYKYKTRTYLLSKHLLYIS